MGSAPKVPGKRKRLKLPMGFPSRGFSTSVSSDLEILSTFDLRELEGVLEDTMVVMRGEILDSRRVGKMDV
jgi:hypothetical protein